MLLIAVLSLSACAVQTPVKVDLPPGPHVPVSWAKSSDDMKGGIQNLYGKTCLGTFMTIDQLGVRSRFAITIRSDRAAADMRIPNDATYAEAKAALEKYGMRVHSKRVDLNTFIIGTRESNMALRLIYNNPNSFTGQYIEGGYDNGIHAEFVCQ